MKLVSCGDGRGGENKNNKNNNKLINHSYAYFNIIIIHNTI